MKILHLTLKKKWFDLIASGKKTIELRDMTPYWTSRLTENGHKFKKFDEVHFRNGYKKDVPFMRICCGEINVTYPPCKYQINLGGILEIRNYKK